VVAVAVDRARARAGTRAGTEGVTGTTDGPGVGVDSVAGAGIENRAGTRI